jgi:ParB-like chromosome segregation protein Spo0J
MKTPGAIEVASGFREAVSEWLSGFNGQELFDALNGIRDFLHERSPNADMPVDIVRWVPIEQVTPNDYNPNHVAKVEMGLLLKSITADGYTQPVVTVWNPERVLPCRRCEGHGVMVDSATCVACGGSGDFKGCFEFVDGFHRYWTMRSNEELRKKCNDRLPIVVLDKQINDRMASTVRHNRARGKHSVDGMANMVFSMLENGMDDAAICNELGMEAEELVRLKHITGFSKLFADTQYQRAWVTKNQIRLRLARGGKVSEAEKVSVGLVETEAETVATE